MKKILFSRKCFFTDFYFHCTYMKMKMPWSCSPRRAGSKHVLIDFERPNQNLTTGQVMSRSGRDSSMSICISFEATWQDKSFATICVSLSPSCRDLLANNVLWPRMTFPWHSINSCTRIITDGMSDHDSEIGAWFRIVYEERWIIFIFSHRLITRGAESESESESLGVVAATQESESESESMKLPRIRLRNVWFEYVV